MVTVSSTMIRRCSITIVVLLAVTTAWTLPSAASGTIVVNTPFDIVANDGHCSLREAIMAANNDTATGGCNAGSGADQVVLPAQRMTLGGSELNVTTAVTIRGAGASATSIDAHGLSRVLRVQASGALTIDGVEITGGRTTAGGAGLPSGDGGGIFNAGALALRNS